MEKRQTLWANFVPTTQLSGLAIPLAIRGSVVTENSVVPFRWTKKEGFVLSEKMQN